MKINLGLTLATALSIYSMPLSSSPLEKKGYSFNITPEPENPTYNMRVIPCRRENLFEAPNFDFDWKFNDNNNYNKYNSLKHNKYNSSNIKVSNHNFQRFHSYFMKNKDTSKLSSTRKKSPEIKKFEYGIKQGILGKKTRYPKRKHSSLFT